MSTSINFRQTNIAFDTSNEKIFAWLKFFNPEPIISSFAKEHLPEANLIRLIKWQSLSRSGEINTHFYRQEFPFKHSIALIRDQITAVNFEYYLKDSQNLPQNIHNFTITEISWLIHTSTAKDPFAPPMAPKRHSEGIQVVLKDERLTASYLSFSMGAGLTSHNRTGIVPVTSQNLESVVIFLKEHMEKNKNNV